MCYVWFGLGSIIRCWIYRRRNENCYFRIYGKNENTKIADIAFRGLHVYTLFDVLQI
jgi:hypothetical protein